MKKLKFLLLSICLLSASLCFVGCEEVKVESVKFNQQKITLVEGTNNFEIFANVVEDNSKLVATVLPYNAKNRTVSFKVDNSNIIEISGNNIIAKSEGVAYVTVTTKDGNFSTSVVVEVVKNVQPLETVQNVRYENNKIVWDEVDNADYYSVLLNNGSALDTVSPEFSDFESGINNSVQVIAHSVGNAYSASQPSESFNFKQLNAPTQITNENYVVRWDSIVDAVSYDIYLDNEKINTESLSVTNFEINSELLSDNKIHKVSIVANGNNVNNFSSAHSNTYNLQVLTAPTSIMLSQGVVVFNQVNYANSYNVKIDNQVYQSTSNVFAIPEEVQGGEHTLTVQAVGASNNYISSQYSLTSLDFTKLATIENFTVENNTIMWDKVVNAGGYLISVNDVIYDLGTTSSFYIGEDFIEGNYSIKIACVGTGNQYVMSNFSSEKVLTKLATPLNLQIVNGKVTYNAVENASSYMLDINGVKKSVSASEITNNMASLDLQLESGNYNIKVQAIGDGKTYLNSSYSTVINASKLDTPSMPVLEDGIIKWNAIKNSFGYNVKLNDEVYEFNSLQTRNGQVLLDISASEYSASVYSIQVQALSTEGNINSDYSAVATFKKYETPTSVKAHQGNLAFSYNMNAKKYNLSINGSVSQVNVSDLLFDNDMQPSLFVYENKFTTYFNKNLEVKLSVQGNDEYISSAYSEAEIFTMCKTVENLKIENNILSYTNPNDGTLYVSYKGTNANGALVEIEETETEQTSFSLPTFLDNETLNAGTYTFTIKAKGNSVNVLNGVEVQIQAEILSTPVNFSIEEGLIKWNAVTNVTNYKLKVHNAEGNYVKEVVVSNALNCSLATATDLETDKDYTVYIQALGNGKTTISSEFVTDAESLTVNILSTPQNLRVEEGVIAWDKVSNASVYGMYIDGKLSSTISENIETLQDGIPYGTHNIQIYAVGDSSKYLTGACSVNFEIVKLETPLNLKIKKNTETNKANLYCDIPAYASGVGLLKEFNGEVTYEFFPKEENQSGIQFDVSEMPSGFYKYQAFAVGDNTKYVSSSRSLVCSTTVMASPEKVYLNKGVVTWSSVVGVSSYNLYVDYYGENNSELVSTQEITGIESNNYVLNLDFIKGYYKLSVKSIGDETKFITSQRSTEIDVEKLGIPKSLSTEAGVIVFNELNGAYEYAIYVDGKECGRTKKDSSSLIKYELPETVAAGTHQIMVQAIGDDSKYISGEAGATVATSGTAIEVIGATMEVIKLSTVNDFKIENGVITWLPYELANGYSLKINEVNFSNEIETSTTKSFYELGEDITVGKKSIKLKAIGRNLEDGRRILNSNYSTAIEATKLEQVTNIKAIYNDDVNSCGVVSWDRISNNNGYIIKIEGIEEEIITNKNQETYEFVSTDIPSGELKIIIKARGSSSTSSYNYLNGNFSEQKTFIKLETPTDFKIEGGNLTWAYPSSGYSFIVSITNNDVEQLKLVTEQFAVLDTNFDSGSYKIKVKAVGKEGIDSADSLNSSYTDIINAIKPERPDNVSVDEFGVIRWNAVASATSYVVKAIYKAPGGTSAEVEQVYDNLPENICYLGASGIYKFSVFAVSAQGLYSDSSVEIETVFDGFSVGRGTQSDPYEVSNIEDFIRVSKYPEAYFIQTTNIDMSGYVDADGKQMEVSAMFTEKHFAGNYNAQGYKVSNLKLTGSSTEYELGLFSVISATGVVKNLILENVSVNITSLKGAGGIAGRNFGTILNCSVVSGTIQNNTSALDNLSSPNIGGIVAYNSGTVQLCHSDIVAKGLTENTQNSSLCFITIGGISGANYGIIKQSSTASTTEIYGNLAGGIVGLNSGLVEQCVNKASVTGTNIKLDASQIRNGYAGGIVGSNAIGDSTIIYNCYNLGVIKCVNTSVNSTNYSLFASGIAGINNSGNSGKAKILNCYNFETVEAYIIDGGITYNNLSICYNGSNGYINYSYSKTAIANAIKNGTNYVENYATKTTQEMQSEAFANLLNQNISSIVAIEGFEHLSSENCWKQLSNGTVGFAWQE